MTTASRTILTRVPNKARLEHRHTEQWQWYISSGGASMRMRTAPHKQVP
jgi:hypothetical protein